MVEVIESHTDAPHSVGRLWKGVRPVTEMAVQIKCENKLILQDGE